MLITNILGGLGNQLFCYYSSLSFARKNKIDLYIDEYDYKFYRKDRLFNLDKFEINYKIADTKLLKKIRYLPKTKIDNYLIQKFNINTINKNINLIVDNDSIDSRSYFINKNQINYMKGYWQNFKFFENLKDHVKKEINLKFKSNLIKSIISKINSSNSCSIHVRRGDYLLKPYNDIYISCSIEYYKNAIKIINEKFQNTQFFIFTDDLNWAKLNFSSMKNCFFIKDYNLKDFEEFYILSQCAHHIISNSTFSKFGAWINSNSNSIIIEPNKWFKYGEKSQLFFDNSIKLEN